MLEETSIFTSGNLETNCWYAILRCTKLNRRKKCIYDLYVNDFTRCINILCIKIETKIIGWCKFKIKTIISDYGKISSKRCCKVYQSIFFRS